MGKEKSGVPGQTRPLDAERGKYAIPAGLLTTTTFNDHSARHENTGLDEISVAGLSGLLADDQHVLDAEVISSNTPAGSYKKITSMYIDPVAETLQVNYED